MSGGTESQGRTPDAHQPGDDYLRIRLEHLGGFREVGQRGTQPRHPAGPQRPDLPDRAAPRHRGHGERAPAHSPGAAILSSDALSSVAYGPEAGLAMLAAAGAGALILNVPIGIAIAVLMIIVTTSYRQVVRGYQQGGGSYAVARANLGLLFGLVAAAALLVDDDRHRGRLRRRAQLLAPRGQERGPDADHPGQPPGRPLAGRGGAGRRVRGRARQRRQPHRALADRRGGLPGAGAVRLLRVPVRHPTGPAAGGQHQLQRLPRLSAILARDHLLPLHFAHLGNRLVYSTGIVLLAVSAELLILVFHGNTNALIDLYALGVFAAFTLAQFGMARHWWRERGSGWRHGLAVNACGAVVTDVVDVVIIVTRSPHGAWVILVVVPLLVLLFLTISRHYAGVQAELAGIDDRARPLASGPAVVPVFQLDASARTALRYAMALSPEVVAIHQVRDDPEASRFQQARDACRWPPGHAPPRL